MPELKKPYWLIDPTSFEPVGRIELDLDDPLLSQRVVLDTDLGRDLGPHMMRVKGRVFDSIQRGNVDAGVFPSGEHPKRLS